jgi:hypothetical protein
MNLSSLFQVGKFLRLESQQNVGHFPVRTMRHFLNSRGRTLRRIMCGASSLSSSHTHTPWGFVRVSGRFKAFSVAASLPSMINKKAALNFNERRSLRKFPTQNTAEKNYHAK